MMIPMPALNELPDDILLEIMSYLDIADILRIRKLCLNLCRVTKLRHVWLTVLSHCSPPATLPTYCKPFVTLSSHSIEVLVKHIARVRHRLSMQTKPFVCIRLDRTRGVTWVYILQGQWILVATADSSVSELSLWSIDDLFHRTTYDGAPPPAAIAYLDGPVAIGLVDMEGGRVIMALEIQSSNPSTEIASIAIRDGSPIFVRLARLPGVARIRCLAGFLLGFAVAEEVSVPSVINWRTHELNRLRDRPDITGGCIAMAIRHGVVCVVTPMHLEVYTHGLVKPSNGSTYRLHAQMVVPRSVTDVSLVFIDASGGQATSDRGTLCTLRLLWAASTRPPRLHVSDVVVPAHSGECIVHSAWTTPASSRICMSKPRFGKRADSVSWITSPQQSPWSHPALATTTAPISLSSPSSSYSTSALSTAEVFDSEMPALQYASVRDYDETLGLLLCGNACGELGLCSLSNVHLCALASCLLEVPMPFLGEEDVLPTSPIAARATPPYPHSIYPAEKLPTPERRQRLVAMWRPQQVFDDPIPAHWTTDFLHPEYDYLQWWRYASTMFVDGTAWLLEHTAHYYGTVFLLLYNEHDGMAIFKAGGLLFLCDEDSEKIYVAHYGVSPTQLALAINEDREDVLLAHTVCDSQMTSQEKYQDYALWEWEKRILGRDRWAELKARGGEVDPGWLVD